MTTGQNNNDPERERLRRYLETERQKVYAERRRRQELDALARPLLNGLFKAREKTWTRRRLGEMLVGYESIADFVARAPAAELKRFDALLEELENPTLDAPYFGPK